MLIKYFGTADNFFAQGLYGSGTHVPHITDASTSTVLFVEPTDAGLNATFTGVQFELFPGNIPIGGTITGLNIDQGATRIAEFSDMSWDADLLFTALGNAPTDESLLNGFINVEPITIDARQATSALNDFQDHFSFSADLTIKGSAFGDNLVGGSGDDLISGNKGNDIFRSGAGDDIAKGGRGHDVFFNSQGADSFDGAAGIDTVIDIASTWALDLGSVSVNLTTGSHQFSTLSDENDTLTAIENYTFRGSEDVTAFGSDTENTLKTGRGEDYLVGLKGNDLLFGGRGADVLKGGAGNDRLFGGRGGDNIFGGTGDDTIFSGGGKDRIKGGSGADTFVFNDVALDHRNVITDFEDGSDLIRVTKNAGFDAIQISGLNGDADTLIVLSGGTKIILKDVVSTAIDITDFDLG